MTLTAGGGGGAGEALLSLHAGSTSGSSRSGAMRVALRTMVMRNTASAPAAMPDAVQQKVDTRIEETIVGARSEPAHAKMHVEQRLVRQRGGDRSGGHRRVGVSAELAVLLAFLDQLLDEPPALD